MMSLISVLHLGRAPRGARGLKFFGLRLDDLQFYVVPLAGHVD